MTSARGLFFAGLAVVLGVATWPASLASGGTPLTKAQFITKANALCAAAAAQFLPEEQKFKGKAVTPQLVASFVADFVPVVQEQINKTKALTPPKSVQAQVTKMLTTDQDELNALKANPQLLGGKKSPFVVADGLARKFGLSGAPGSSVCSK